MSSAERADPRAVARDAAKVLRDLRRLGSLLRIKTKANGIVTFDYSKWHPEQRAFQRDRTGRDVILKARQVGFTTEELGRDVQYARTHEGVQVLIVSQDAELAEVLFQAAHLMVRGLVELGLCPKPKYSTRREIVFSDNHSAIRVVEAGSTEKSADNKGRSGTINRLHATEVAFWGAAQNTMTALLAAVPESGEVVIESTANGSQGLFYELCTTALAGGGEYKLHFYPWHMHPTYRRAVPADFDLRPRDRWEERLRAAGCDDEQIAWWRSLVDNPARGGLERVLQEYPVDPQSCFRSPGGAYLPTECADWLGEQVRKPLALETIEVTSGGASRKLGELVVYEQPVPGGSYIAAADVAEGIGKDASTIDVSEWRTGRTVATFASDTIEAGDHGLALAWVATKYNGALVAPERNKDGAAVLRVLTREESSVTPYPRIYTHDDGRLGWPTTPATRPVLFDDSRRAIEERCWLTPDARTAAEARTLVKVDGKPVARGKGTAGGAKDDAWVAKAIGWQVRQRASDEAGTVETGATRETSSLQGYW
ncbi:hypothetical protein [Sandaracinus amylolyticus]|uniref:Phage protein n=1 Tax=Sandaracinus amylolyticus TaxID=927083 RepID=A0A0F6W6Z7_9BACT|nr:hypothetical protein [Sandaracinus amylolyticus]AKF08871.1 Phage protein [Sandaracinus amylolyticus]